MLLDERVVEGRRIDWFIEDGGRRGIAAVADGHGHVAAQSPHARAGHGSALDGSTEVRVGHSPEPQQIYPCKFGARLPPGIFAGGRNRDRIPRADLLTDVAAIHVPPDAVAKVIGDALLQLDGQIGNAAGRVENAVGDQRLSRARLDAERAGTTSIDIRLVRRERDIAEDFAEKQPRSEVRIDEARVLADPSQPGRRGRNPFDDGTRVHVSARLEGLTHPVSHPRFEF